MPQTPQQTVTDSEIQQLCKFYKRYNTCAAIISNNLYITYREQHPVIYGILLSHIPTSYYQSQLHLLKCHALQWIKQWKVGCGLLNWRVG